MKRLADLKILDCMTEGRSQDPLLAFSICRRTAPGNDLQSPLSTNMWVPGVPVYPSPHLAHAPSQAPHARWVKWILKPKVTEPMRLTPGQMCFLLNTLPFWCFPALSLVRTMMRTQPLPSRISWCVSPQYKQVGDGKPGAHSHFSPVCFSRSTRPAHHEVFSHFSV